MVPNRAQVSWKLGIEDNTARSFGGLGSVRSHLFGGAHHETHTQGFQGEPKGARNRVKIPRFAYFTIDGISSRV